MTVITRKKLIEVALPLEAINAASAREKSIRHGHPSTLHLWWARRPLAAARAVIFAQMVDDPSTYVDTLRSDPARKSAAERELKKRHAAWLERRALHEKAQRAGDTSVAEPGTEPTSAEVLADLERERLFGILRELVKWESTTKEAVLQTARDEIWQSWRRACADNAGHPRAKELFDRKKLPAFHDPFAGGGALPLEAQRLGLESYASDLNPVAVLINKAMIEIPVKFVGRPPLNPAAQVRVAQSGSWRGAQGLAEDVRYYGKWMREEAEKRIGNLYPKIEVTAEMVGIRPDLKPYLGQHLTVIAWLWARTVRSPNPAFTTVEVPLASTFILSAKEGRDAYVEPVIDGGRYRFAVKVGKAKSVDSAKSGTKFARANFGCLLSGTPIAGDYIKAEGKAGRMGSRLMAIVADGGHGRIYLSPTSEQEEVAAKAEPAWRPDGAIATRMTGGNCTPYGLTSWGDLFTQRQLVSLTTLSDLVREAIARAERDALASGMDDDRKSLRDGGIGALAYAEAVGVYLGLAVDKATDYNTTLVAWSPTRDQAKSTFARQALPMIWDYAEVNLLAGAAGDFAVSLEGGVRYLETASSSVSGHVSQADAATQSISARKVVSTDPPYYDNIGYADLSDFFYVWLRRSLRPIFPDLFGTLAVPKAEELVATPYRHGGREKAESFFLDGMTRAMHRLAGQAHEVFPVTIYYAFKQSESDDDAGTASTGWDTFLDAVIRAGFAISGTWPMRTERGSRSIGIGTNALASSIILVCRPRPADSHTATRREFLTALKAELPQALAHLQRGNIAPVDLAQAAIGPGMAVYTRYVNVLDAEGKSLTVREALALINQTLDEALAEQEGDFDADSRWAVTWFDQHGFAEGEYGVAEVLATAKATSIAGLAQAGILRSSRGKVRLLKPDELDPGWDPTNDARLTAWETVHQLVRALEAGGESMAATLVARLGTKAEAARELAYRLYTICERRKRAAEALSYNALVQSWPQIVGLASQLAPVLADATQVDLL